MRTRVTLRSSKDDRGSRSLVAGLNARGDLVFDGQDLGRAVEEFWGEGNTEYEWKLTVPADHITTAIEALGGSQKSDPLEYLKAWFAYGNDHELKPLLEEAGIPIDFTSRIGD